MAKLTAAKTESSTAGARVGGRDRPPAAHHDGGHDAGDGGAAWSTTRPTAARPGPPSTATA
eukprot:2620613-Pleurochrysis_carterae.AAC.1